MDTGKRTASLILGIIGLVLGALAFITPILGWLGFLALPLGIVAIVLAVNSNKAGVRATGGFVTGILAVVFGGIGVACFLACAAVVAEL